MSPAGPGDRPLHGKVAVVTGGGRGIGRAIALAYAEAGAAVCCTARTREEIEDTAARIRGAGGTGIAVAADVTDPRAVERMFDTAAEALGGIDILVANAGGVLESKPVTEGDPALWEATVAVNLFGAYHCIRAAIPHLKRRGGGKILTLGSGMGHNGLAGHSSYCCAKAALWMLTRVCARELWADGISVNELVPGPVLTDATRRRRRRRRHRQRVGEVPGGCGAPGPVPGHPAGGGAHGAELQPHAPRRLTCKPRGSGGAPGAANPRSRRPEPESLWAWSPGECVAASRGEAPAASRIRGAAVPGSRGRAARRRGRRAGR